MVRGSTGVSATSAGISTVSVNANAGAASSSSFPSAAAPPTHSGTGHGTHNTQERPTAVRDRVAEEVLTFMAAIERGEVPTAVGLPLPPGANIFDSLRGPGGLGGERARRNSAPASKEALRRLTRFKVRPSGIPKNQREEQFDSSSWSPMGQAHRTHQSVTLEQSSTWRQVFLANDSTR